MSVEAYLLPLATWMRGEFRVPMEKYCRGKGVELFDVGQPWSLDPEAARANAEAWWRAATGGAPTEPDGASPHAELLDGDGLERLCALAAAGPDGGAGAPHLLARPRGGGVVYLPAPVAAVANVERCGDGVPMALGSAMALRAELDALGGRLGPARAWGEVREGELAAAHDDPRFAEKTAWSILRFLAAESERRGLPLILPPMEDGA